MADINHVVLVGRLTRDAELKYTQGGAAVCKFSIAVNRRRKNGEEWVEEVNYFDIVLWGRQGEALNQYLVKGKQVAVDGELRQNRWEQDGQSRSKVEIIAEAVSRQVAAIGKHISDQMRLRHIRLGKICHRLMTVMKLILIMLIMTIFHFKENKTCRTRH